jgi:hypothetical protein
MCTYYYRRHYTMCPGGCATTTRTTNIFIDWLHMILSYTLYVIIIMCVCVETINVYNIIAGEVRRYLYNVVHTHTNTISIYLRIARTEFEYTLVGGGLRFFFSLFEIVLYYYAKNDERCSLIRTRTTTII